MKHCLSCDTIREMSEWYKNKGKPDGYASVCKYCADIATRRWRRENPPNAEKVKHIKKVHKKYVEENPDKVSSSKKEYNQRNRWKRAVLNRVRRAIRSGKLVRESCVVCGERNTHAHHEDYSKPLDVVWLCRKHHDVRHVEIRDLV